MKYYSHVIFALLYFPLVCSGAKAPYSEEKLQQVATHIVIGKVKAIYSMKQVEGIPLMDSFNYERKVAEVIVEKVTKGKLAESLVYVRYWSRTWNGIMRQPPGGQSYFPQPKMGQVCRFYLAKNSYDGWSKDKNNDGGYNVVYVNGVQPIDSNHND